MRACYTHSCVLSAWPAAVINGLVIAESTTVEIVNARYQCSLGRCNWLSLPCAVTHCEIVLVVSNSCRFYFPGDSLVRKYFKDSSFTWT